MPSNSYKVGDLVRVRGIFVKGGAMSDPTTVKCKYKAPAATTVTKVYLTDAEVIKEATGQYYMDINLTVAGTWWFAWEGTGVVQAVNEDSFEVKALNV